MATSGEPETLEQQNVIGVVDGAETLALVADEIQQLQGFVRLEPDWNSYGAHPVAQAAVTMAIDLLRHVARMTHTRPDFVGPLANGGIQLEWSGADAEIAVRVYPNQTLAYLYTERSTHTERDAVSLSEIITLVAQTLSR